MTSCINSEIESESISDDAKTQLNNITFELIIQPKEQVENLDESYVYIFDSRTNKYYKIVKNRFIEKYFGTKICEYVTFQGSIKDFLTDITIPQRQNILHLWSKKINTDAKNLKSNLDHIVRILDDLNCGKPISIIKTNDALPDHVHWLLIIRTSSMIKNYNTNIIINSDQSKIYIKSNRQDTLPSLSVFSLSYTVSSIDSDIDIPITGNDEITRKIKYMLNIVINTLRNN